MWSPTPSRREDGYPWKYKKGNPLGSPYSVKPIIRPSGSLIDSSYFLIEAAPRHCPLGLNENLWFLGVSLVAHAPRQLRDKLCIFECSRLTIDRLPHSPKEEFKSETLVGRVGPFLFSSRARVAWCYTRHHPYELTNRLRPANTSAHWGLAAVASFGLF